VVLGDGATLAPLNLENSAVHLILGRDTRRDASARHVRRSDSKFASTSAWYTLEELAEIVSLANAKKPITLRSTIPFRPGDCRPFPAARRDWRTTDACGCGLRAEQKRGGQVNRDITQARNPT